MAHLDEYGREVLSQEPVALPIKIRRQSFVDQIRDLIKRELSNRAEEQDYETFEESDDFDVGDEDWLKSPYEIPADDEFADMYPIEKDKPVSTPQPPEAAKEAEPESGSGDAQGG